MSDRQKPRQEMYHAKAQRRKGRKSQANILKITPWSLQHRVDQASGILDGLPPARALLPGLEREFIRFGKVSLLDASQSRRDLCIVNDQVDFGVQQERAHVEIARTDDGDLIVEGEVFGVQQVLAIEMNMHSGLHQLFVV